MKPINVGFDIGGYDEQHTITAHADIECGYERNPLDYFVTLPSGGVNEQTGLVMVIPGFGERPDSAYHQEKLRPYIADTYNCIAVGVSYFGVKLRAPDPQAVQYHLPDIPTFISTVQSLYGIPASTFSRGNNLSIEALSRALLSMGIKRLPMELRLYKTHTGMKPEYETFGFLSAVDHLTVLGDVLKRYPVNRRRISAFGSSYGGFIAMLMAKFAPHTFAHVIDNSGFVVTRLSELATVHMLGLEGYTTLFGVEYPVTHLSPWEINDETSPLYFSDAHRQIRSLLRRDHVRPTRTHYHLFHSEADALIPIAHKERLVALLREHGVAVAYKKVTPADLDGRLFKTMAHGMDASLRGIFDVVAASDPHGLAKEDTATDFTLNADHRFDCGDRCYVFQFTADHGLTVRLIDR